MALYREAKILLSGYGGQANGWNSWTKFSPFKLQKLTFSGARPAQLLPDSTWIAPLIYQNISYPLNSAPLHLRIQPPLIENEWQWLSFESISTFGQRLTLSFLRNGPAMNFHVYVNDCSVESIDVKKCTIDPATQWMDLTLHLQNNTSLRITCYDVEMMQLVFKKSNCKTGFTVGGNRSKKSIAVCNNFYTPLFLLLWCESKRLQKTS